MAGKSKLQPSVVSVKPDKDKQELIQEKMDKIQASFGTFFYKPFAWQERALEVVRKKNTTAIICSNKIGKCLTYSSCIDTPNGSIPVGKLYESGKPFEVFAWDGKKKIISKAHAPFKKKGFHECYRLNMSDGRWIEAADHHRILTQTGWVFVSDLVKALKLFHFSVPSVQGLECGNEELLKTSSSLRESTSESYPLTQSLNAYHLSGKQSNSQYDYSKDFRPYDEPLRKVSNNDQAFVPLQDDALKHNVLLSDMDGQGNKYSNNPSRLFYRLSSLYALHRPLNRLVEFLNRIFCTKFRYFLNAHQVFLQPCGVGVSGFQSIPLIASRKDDISLQAYNPPLYIDGNRIVSFSLLPSQEVYDFEVEKYHNYFAGGLINHNTTAGANIVISWALGYEPWNVVDKDHPEAIEAGGQYYRKSSLGINPPVNIIITGEDWKLHIGRTLVPELKKWAPRGWYETKKNEQGVDFLWNWNNGSTFTIMCYTQGDDLFESFRAQGCLMDEPPPKSKYSAMSRGLLLDCGKTLMTLTPLKEAWILDDIVLSGRKDIGVIDSLCITENPQLLNGDIRILQGLGFNEKTIKEYFNSLLYDDAEKKIPVSDKGHRAERFLIDRIPIDKQEDIAKLKILKFIKDIDPANVPPRVFGHFKSLVGRVLKEFDDNIHSIEPFKVPTDWVITPMIDFHLSKPQAVSYWAVNKQEIHYCIAEVWQNISADEIADDIIRRKLAGWRIEDVFIDPLSKGDTAYVRNMLGTNIKDSFSIIYDKLSQHGMTLHVASKDKDSGIKNIQTWLKGVNGLPTCYVFDNCERHLFEVKRWVFDENMKPAKEYDDMMENWYRYTLTGASYSNYEIKPLPARASNYGYSGVSNSWMAA